MIFNFPIRKSFPFRQEIDDVLTQLGEIGEITDSQNMWAFIYECALSSQCIQCIDGILSSVALIQKILWNWNVLQGELQNSLTGKACSFKLRKPVFLPCRWNRNGLYRSWDRIFDRDILWEERRKGKFWNWFASKQETHQISICMRYRYLEFNWDEVLHIA